MTTYRLRVHGSFSDQNHYIDVEAETSDEAVRIALKTYSMAQIVPPRKFTFVTRKQFYGEKPR